MPAQAGSRLGAGKRRGRTILAVILAVLLLLAFSLRAIATFWTDYLWFDDLGLETIWGRLLSARVSLAVAATLIFFVIAWVNLSLADRFSSSSTLMLDDEVLERYQSAIAGRQRLVVFAVSLAAALIPGIGAATEWRNWLLFRFGGDFGSTDEQFGRDIGFYVFKLPFLSQVVDWLFGFLLVTLILVVAMYYLNGAIRLQATGERITSATKAHVSVLLALLALVKAADYWLQRFELTYQSRDVFDGAGYTALNATLPALQLLILVALFAAVLFIVNIRSRGWVLPVIAIALWVITAVVVNGIYPAIVQNLQVKPAELNKETPYVKRNITATRVALGLDDVRSTELDYDPELTREKVAGQQANLDQARLLDPNVLEPTIQTLQFGRPYYAFREVDVDRYEIGDAGGETREPVIISTRELNLDGVAAPSWEKLHLVFTHGYGLAAAPANTPNSRGEPDFLVGGIPARVEGLGELQRPEIYVGEGMGGYAIVGTDQQELSSDDLTTSYDGSTGVPIDNFVRKAAFSLRFGDYEPLISDLLTDKSKVIYQRDVVERVQAVAPFLTLGRDPYPVLVDGRIVYVIDGYTTTSHYPYAEAWPADLIADDSTGTLNYLRNSVKAVVDAYDGTVTLYLSDVLYGEKDPIVRAYAKAFPGMFTEEIPADLVEHMRYPEGLFNIQTVAWGRYHQSNPSSFFNNSATWDIAQEPPGDSEASATAAAQAEVAQAQGVPAFDRIPAYYQMMQLTPESKPEFVLTRPFVLASRDDAGRNLTAIMVARNDPGSYGDLEEVVVVGGEDSETRVDGTLQASEKIATYPPVSQYQTVVGQRGSKVQFGNLLLLPFGDSLLYVRPVYARQESNGLNTLQRVAVTSGDRVGFGETLTEAIDDMFLTDEQGNPAGGGATTTTTPEDPATPEEPSGETVPAEGSPEEMLARADDLFTQADEALAAGDLGEYDRLVDEARALLSSALAALGTTTTVPAESTTTTAPPG
jgi:uncharacterized membrane protein (UPF0182 family)